jgi:hypothetical protein
VATAATVAVAAVVVAAAGVVAAAVAVEGIRQNSRTATTTRMVMTVAVAEEV